MPEAAKPTKKITIIAWVTFLPYLLMAHIRASEEK